jgi:hypothetical protein
MSTEAINVILMEPFFPHMAECCICGCDVVLRTFGPNYGIAMYEGIPVPNEWTYEWGGFPACKACFDKHEAGELQRWPGSHPRDPGLSINTDGAK